MTTQTELKDNQFRDGDGQGNVWTLRVSELTSRGLKGLGADPGLLVTERAGELAQALMSDPSLACSCVYLVLENDPLEDPPPPEEFAAGMYGDDISWATKALMEAMADFYGRGKAPALKAMIKKAWAAEEAAAARMIEMIDTLDVEAKVVAEVDRALEQFSKPRRNSG